jgi:hypothetical protein
MAQAAPELGVRYRARNSQVLPPQHESAAAPLPSERPLYPAGTRVYASCLEYDVTGPLVVDHEDLDGIVSLYDEADGRIVRINGWLWSIDLVIDEIAVEVHHA